MTYEYIEFVELPKRESRKTKRWACMNKQSGGCLGVVKWYGAWRQYTFWPEPCTIWSVGCLNDIQDFLKKAKTL